MGLIPYSPQKLAGMRMEPPPSLPSENGPTPVATAAEAIAHTQPMTSTISVSTLRHWASAAVDAEPGVSPRPRGRYCASA